MLYEKIREDLKKSMLARDEMKTTVLRSVIATLSSEALTKGKSTDTFPDEDFNAVVRRLVKQRKDSIEQFRNGNREDLAKNEEAEMKILETYLTKMMSKKDIKKFAEAKKKEMKIEDVKQAMKIVGALMKDLKGKADGGDVKEVVESLF